MVIIYSQGKKSSSYTLILLAEKKIKGPPSARSHLRTAEILVNAVGVQDPATRALAQLHKLFVSIETLDELVAFGQPIRLLGASADADDGASGSDAAAYNPQSLFGEFALAGDH